MCKEFSGVTLQNATTRDIVLVQLEAFACMKHVWGLSLVTKRDIVL